MADDFNPIAIETQTPFETISMEPITVSPTKTDIDYDHLKTGENFRIDR